jgi:hypothetical protein
MELRSTRTDGKGQISEFLAIALGNKKRRLLRFPGWQVIDFILRKEYDRLYKGKR